MITIVDYGVGNLFSLKSSLASIKVDAKVTGDPEEIKRSDKIILPGVGAFADAANKLRACGLDKVVKEEARRGKPILGICLGMQLLFEKSYEYGKHTGLGLIPGSVRPISGVVPKDFKVPQIGWNSLSFPDEAKKSPIFRYLKSGDFVYFVHSYYCECRAEHLIAATEYGATLTAAAQNKNVYGCQFHPEKSGEVGLKILKAFTELGTAKGGEAQ